MGGRETKPYFYVRFRWDRGADLKALEGELGDYEVEWFSIERTKEEFSLFKEESVELKVRADTLRAFVSSVRAVLYQKERAPFTPRDLRLREILLKWYPRKRMSPMPLLFGTEPEFEIAEQ
jgi:hypothetical protein